MDDPAIILDALEIHAKQSLRRGKGSVIHDNTPLDVWDSNAIKERVIGLQRAVRCAAAMEEILVSEGRADV